MEPQWFDVFFCLYSNKIHNRERIVWYNGITKETDLG